ncbi:helix-turn-helix domain-containing protein [Psychrobacter faecalis]|uniref:Helix-turn-helix domain-containing protein n=2 Tax=Psychrobacter TaxID=497 RepID=A0ABT9HE90_9GAMM|nr:helix-turn-helix domain-containing protein [Psychrobacter faecalis]MDP4544087.1 helix-turn-helix domain-containing protein [Psychrobacter faecalis]
MITPQQTLTATQTDTIKAHLITGATISKLESYERYQIMCLAQRVHDLRKAGMEIQSKSTVKNGKRFNLYWLEEEERARYVNGKVTPTDVRGTGEDVCLSNDDTDILLSTFNVEDVRNDQ